MCACLNVCYVYVVGYARMCVCMHVFYVALRKLSAYVVYVMNEMYAVCVYIDAMYMCSLCGYVCM